MFLFRLLYAHRKTSCVLFVMAFSLLLYGLFMPQLNTGKSIPNFDKVAHFCGFFIVFLFSRFATHGWLHRIYWLLPLIAAVLLEYLQGQLVSSRDFSYGDIIANLLGVGAAGALWLGLTKTGQLESDKLS